MAKASYQRLLNVASETGCIGVEVRNDLQSNLFDDKDASSAGELARQQGLRILALSEVSAFNDLSDRAYQSAQELAALASKSGAEAISLIPRNDGQGADAKSRLENLSKTLLKFAPILEHHNVLGYIEPLGFEQASLRSKAEVVDVLQDLNLANRFKLVHDTFHHHLAGGGPVFPEHTAMVHVSGVVDSAIPSSELLDDQRVLVDEQDKLNNLEQLNELAVGGYSGPVSIEAFAPQIHDIKEPTAALSVCFNYIESNLAAAAA